MLLLLAIIIIIMLIIISTYLGVELVCWCVFEGMVLMKEGYILKEKPEGDGSGGYPERERERKKMGAEGRGSWGEGRIKI